MGYELKDIPYIELAQDLEVGSADLNTVRVRELNKPSLRSDPAGSHSKRIKQYAVYINEDNACSTCYASLVYALSHFDPRSIKQWKKKICIGQGFLHKTGSIGIGKCCAGFKYSYPACPPTASDIIKFLQELP
jgi:hypothetical protein